MYISCNANHHTPLCRLPAPENPVSIAASIRTLTPIWLEGQSQVCKSEHCHGHRSVRVRETKSERTCRLHACTCVHVFVWARAPSRVNASLAPRLRLRLHSAARRGRACVHGRAHVCVYKCMCVHARARARLCVCVCMCCVYVCAHARMRVSTGACGCGRACRSVSMCAHPRALTGARDRQMPAPAWCVWSAPLTCHRVGRCSFL